MRPEITNRQVGAGREGRLGPARGAARDLLVAEEVEDVAVGEDEREAAVVKLSRPDAARELAALRDERILADGNHLAVGVGLNVPRIKLRRARRRASPRRRWVVGTAGHRVVAWVRVVVCAPARWDRR